MTEHCEPKPEPPMPQQLCGPMRHIMFGLGIVFLLIGIAGFILPLLPGTVFLILSAWAFSRSSERFHIWLYTHPYFGAGIRNWHCHRIIPVKAKVMAVSMMAVSFGIVVFNTSTTSVVPFIVGATLAAVATWIVTRPSQVQALTGTKTHREDGSYAPSGS
ncbi:MAG: YbaN family protein [Rhodospirillaceae bacterium]|nr:YbaN family protein [Rhodospirillaceae bacterium]